MTRGFKFALFFLLSALLVAGQERTVTGEYRNNAEGFAVRIPQGMKGIAGDEAGPERGVKIALSSGGSVTVFGEPNSLEYKTAAQGVRDDLSRYHCGEPSLTTLRVGSFEGTSGKVVCGQRVIEETLVFRPQRHLYWLRLETTPTHIEEDEAALRNIAHGFRLVPWR